jgi:hypothetical protein
MHILKMSARDGTVTYPGDTAVTPTWAHMCLHLTHLDIVILILFLYFPTPPTSPAPVPVSYFMPVVVERVVRQAG